MQLKYNSISFRENILVYVSKISEMNASKRVCIIGAGAAGLAAIRNINASECLTGTVFESSSDIGGIWNYSDRIGTDDHGYFVHSPMYRGLRTNLPKQIMGYLDFQFSKGNRSFISHKEVLEFLNDYADHFNLRKNIQFNSRVVKVKPVGVSRNDSLDTIREEANYSERWEVTIQKWDPSSASSITMMKVFDSIIMCPGHYCTPRIPTIKNIESFTGLVMHSRDYRIPEPFRNKRILIVGCGPSGVDIALELSEVAEQLIVSLWKPPYPGKLPSSIKQVGPIAEARSTSVTFQDGTELDFDVILYCTGYLHDYPFLTPECNLEVPEGKFIRPLYRHLININHPTMSIFGIPMRVCPFILFDCQARYFVAFLEGKFQLPPKSQMLEEWEADLAFRKSQGLPLHRLHEFEQLQWPYHVTLAQDASFTHLLPKPIIRQIYEQVAGRRRAVPQTYRHDEVVLIDQDHYELIQASDE